MLSIPVIKRTVSDLGKQYGADRMYLFGSYARGDATETSDIDIRIDPGHIRGLFQLSGLRLELENRLGLPVDLLTSDSLDEDFMNRIAKEEVLLYAAG